MRQHVPKRYCTLRYQVLKANKELAKYKETVKCRIRDMGDMMFQGIPMAMLPIYTIVSKRFFIITITASEACPGTCVKIQGLQDVIKLCEWRAA